MGFTDYSGHTLPYTGAKKRRLGSSLPYRLLY